MDNEYSFRLQKNSGQILVIILLILAVALTVGLSVISRSFVDIQISQQEEESTRAFSIAEAGLEEALRQGRAIPEGVVVDTEWGSVSAYVEKADFGSGSVFDFGGEYFEEGDVRTLWLVGHDTDGNPDPAEGSYDKTVPLTICFGENGSAEVPALSLAVFFLRGGDFWVTRGGYDRNAAVNDNNFANPLDATDPQCGNFKYQADVDLVDDLAVPSNGEPYALRIRYLNTTDAHPLLAKAGIGALIPSQGSCYESTATIPTSGITRKIQHCRYFEAPPGIFDYVLFSQQDLVKDD